MNTYWKLLNREGAQEQRALVPTLVSTLGTVISLCDLNEQDGSHVANTVCR